MGQELSDERMIRIQRVQIQEITKIMKAKPSGPFLYKECYVQNKTNFDEIEGIAEAHGSKKYDLYLWGVPIQNDEIKLLSALTNKSAIHFIFQLVINKSRKISFEWSPSGFSVEDYDIINISNIF